MTSNFVFGVEFSYKNNKFPEFWGDFDGIPVFLWNSRNYGGILNLQTLSENLKTLV